VVAVTGRLRFGRLVWALAAAALAASAGCMSPAQRREESLQKTAREFNDGLRWGRDDQVFRSLPAAEARLMQARRADLGDDFVVADHEVTSVMTVPGAEKATVVAEFSWFNQRRGVVQKSRIEEKWEWLDGRWLVTSQRRVGGDRFPLVPEREDHHDPGSKPKEDPNPTR
jgi:hypothetical protein